MFNFSMLYSSKDTMSLYLFHTYQKICQYDDDLKKKEELKILLAQIESYYKGLLATPDLVHHASWLLLWSFAVQTFSNNNFFYYLCWLSIAYQVMQCFDDIMRYPQREMIRERYAQLESLMISIKLRLDSK